MATTLANCLRADTVSALRLREVCRATPSTPIEQVVRCMAERRSGFVLVQNGAAGAGAAGAGGGEIVGIFTERDFVNRVVTQDLDVSLPIEAVMTPRPTTIAAGASVLQAVELMSGGGYRHLPVTGEDGQPVGVLSVKDVVHYLVEYFPAQVYNLPPTPELQQPVREGA